jgi:uncharacterized membrane protein YqhA
MTAETAADSVDPADDTEPEPDRGTARVLALMGAIMHLSVVAVVGLLVGAVLMFVVGVASTVDAVGGYLWDHDGEQSAGDGLLAMTEAVAALDEFLFGLLLLVFAAGIYQLFLAPNVTRSQMRRHLPVWIHVANLTELKIRLVELVVVVLVVQFFRLVLIEFDELSWSALVVPIAIAVFAGLIWVLDRVERGSGADDGA